MEVRRKFHDGTKAESLDAGVETVRKAGLGGLADIAVTASENRRITVTVRLESGKAEFTGVKACGMSFPDRQPESAYLRLGFYGGAETTMMMDRAFVQASFIETRGKGTKTAGNGNTRK